MAIALNGQRSIEWTSPRGTPSGFEPREIVFGKSDMAGIDPIEFAVAGWVAAGKPTREALVKLHGLRLDKRATSVVIVVELQNGDVLILGPNAATAPVGPLTGEQAERMLQAVLDEPTVIAARTRLAGVSQAIDSTSIPGVKNSGLFANHELRVGVTQRADWADACAASSGLLSNRGQDLIKSLGYTAQQAGAHGLVLSGEGPHPQAIAVMIDEKETFEAESLRFTVSPVAYGLKLAETNGVPWLIILRGTQIRLYPAKVELGVGRKGLAETFCEIDLPQLTLDNSGYLSLIFSTGALVEGGTAHQIMQESLQYAVALGARLRDKVYDDVVPELAVAVADQLIDLGFEMTAEDLDLAYQLTLRIFFRLLFQVYAEDRRLLPFGENQKYDRNALKTVALDLVEDPGQAFDENSTSLWDDLAQVWRVIDSGDKAWGVPAYNGGLFTSDPEYNQHGALIKKIVVDNSVMGPILKAMLLDEDEAGAVGPIDFRSLSVREFGTIYEGLLESSLGLAEVNLTLDDKDTWVPAKKGDEVWAEAGQVYFHNTSGQRKGTGSYFTPSFVVEHLLERSLDLALDEHLGKVADLLERGDEAGANDLFFDFRVADLAMGSGHFLTAAIDHIEMKMAAFLSEEGHAVPGVAKELALLAHAARDAIGAYNAEPEASSLLRRQIARRCIYGLDINPIAVELARVSIWIHTFVRGLPMSSLDHNLVCANSLTGIGSIEEAIGVLTPGTGGQFSLLVEPIEVALTTARNTLIDASKLLEIDRKETQAASKAVARAREEAETAKLLFDAAVLVLIGEGDDFLKLLDPTSIAKKAVLPRVQAVLTPLNPAHMPVLFPEVFLRVNRGFDVLIGNPPFLNRVKSVGDGLELEKEIAKQRWPKVVKPYTDQASLFMIRNSDLLSSSGYMAILQPESFLAARDSAAIRNVLVSDHRVCHLWVATRSVFQGAEVRTCAVVLSGMDHESTVITRSVDSPPRMVESIGISGETLSTSGTWSMLISDLYGVPRVEKSSSSRLKDFAVCTADFRDQYYGLVPFVVDGEKGDLSPKFVTTGLIEPMECLWGKKSTKFNKSTFANPIVDMKAMDPATSIAKWASSRLVPKILVATQGKILEAVVDADGEMIPCVPVLTVIPNEPADIWKLAALFACPVVAAHAAESSMGAGLAGGAIKLSATQLADLPTPHDEVKWLNAASALESIAGKGRVPTHQELEVIAALMDESFGVTANSARIWWLERL